MNFKKAIVVLITIFSCLNAQSQDLSIQNARDYVIGGIKVTGNVSFNEQTVITYSGLRKGQEVAIPGEAISNAIKKLWNSNLFSDVNVYIDRTEGNVIFLELEIQELPELDVVQVLGLKKKGKKEEVIKESKLKKGVKVTENLVTTTKNYLKGKYQKEGYLNSEIKISTIPKKDSTGKTLVKMIVDIDKGEKVKVDEINFNGNEKLSDNKLRKAMKNTKKKNPIRVYKRSKFIKEDFEEDLKSVEDKYKENGYRDARIVKDTLRKNSDNNITLDIDVEEGNRYYIGDIDFLGNTVYSDAVLRAKLGIVKGDVYNGVLLEKRIQDDSKPDADDLINLYQNNGYLFSSINTVEVNVQNDTIDFEIRITEGKPAYFNKVSIVGNDKTNDRVIYRMLRTRPGMLYSKQAVVRSIRELGQLGFFDPEQISPNFKNVNPNEGTLDIEYSVVEKGSSQIELQGGFGGGGFVGTLGLSFNNFSIRNIFKKEEYKPLPMGDGQRLSLRLQASRFFQTYSFSFSEPWLGGKKPVQFSTSLSHTVQYLFNARANDVDRDRRFLISGITIGLAKNLKVPDDYFVLSHALTFQHYNLKNYNTGLFTFGNGFSNNFAYTVGISRNNTYTNPIYPLGGSNFNLSVKLTPPYSLLNGIDYGNLGNEPEFQDENGDPDVSKIDQERFKWLEFYKVKFKAEWFNRIIDQLVLRSNVELGYLGAYNNDRGVIPFERFFLGGDGLGAFSLDGREAIALRGYPNQALSAQDGGTIYNKFSLELRYPITLKSQASIYGLTFIEGGASYDGFRDYNPFQLNRSAGLGIRIFMPAFGLLGIDFGHGFDPLPGLTTKNGWETHFIIGRQL
ncbi:MAG: BamA/TamA family outer membrane protein [Flavobacteriaceae bacterium]|nr:BamA/TamA family outer membrane protein [Flavobacteriaceae bacterium]